MMPITVYARGHDDSVCTTNAVASVKYQLNKLYLLWTKL